MKHSHNVRAIWPSNAAAGRGRLGVGIRERVGAVLVGGDGSFVTGVGGT